MARWRPAALVYGHQQGKNLYCASRKDISTHLKLKKMLSVPYYPQENGASCAAASLRMLFGYYNLFIPEAEIRSFANTTKEGTAREEIVDALEEYDFWCVDGVRGTICDITSLIDQGHPVLVDWCLWPEREGHYSVLLGYEHNTLYIHDPCNRARERISNRQFLKAWAYNYPKVKKVMAGEPNWYLFCGPKRSIIRFPHAQKAKA